MTIEIKSERVPGVPGKRFREGGKLHRRVRIFLKGTDKELDPIDSVEYELHPTFRRRYRISGDREGKFEIRIWTYGYFNIRATLSMKDGKQEVVTGFVKWKPGD